MNTSVNMMNETEMNMSSFQTCIFTPEIDIEISLGMTFVNYKVSALEINIAACTFISCQFSKHMVSCGHLEVTLPEWQSLISILKV